MGIDIEVLVKALEPGGYNAAPTELKQGCPGLMIEDLDVVMERVSRRNERIAFYGLNRRTTVPITMVCECGAEKCKSNIHSDWCPKCAK